MKTIHIVFVNLMLISIVFSDTVTVQGNAYLTGATDHSGIRVDFNRIAPTPFSTSTTTNTAGNYSANIPTGIYNIKFSKTGYRPDSIINRPIYFPLTLPNITLHETGFCGAVSGTLAVDTYDVEDDIYVPSGEALVINPGTVLRFADSVEFIVYGDLIVNGGDSISVVFTKKPGTSGWKGIRTEGYYGGQIYLEGCLIEFAFYCAINIHRDFPLTMRNCEIRFCGRAIYTELANFNIEKTDIHDCNGDNILRLQCLTSSVIEKCRIYDNSPRVNLIVLKSHETDLEFVNCAIYDNDIPGYALLTEWHTSNNMICIANCVFYNNTCRVDTSYMPVIYGAANTTILLNTVISNNNGTGIDGPIYAFNNDLWHNSRGDFGPNVRPWTGVNVTINSNGDSCDAYGNIEVAPMFVNPSAADFHLNASSHCIDAGIGFVIISAWDTVRAPTDDIDDGPRPVGLTWDIGVDEFGSAYVTEIIKPYKEKIKVFPNPFNSSCVMYVPAGVVVKIYNINGKLMNVLNAETGRLIWRPEESVPSGIYIIEAYTKGEELTARVVFLK